ncbi:hypothetical protein N7478_003740 [Penicillium angulare]|uniref:uncharacterized protein n=1 Tax=Penicillium angulare TaxID=116970 RepID=UPI0025423679|nr:uncharacterized protein N7478_003740 [Penicillium angulare]KAJ5288054.1 hypothetical protein N7478_003740 [Penicillium angulare]
MVTLFDSFSSLTSKLVLCEPRACTDPRSQGLVSANFGNQISSNSNENDVRIWDVCLLQACQRLFDRSSNQFILAEVYLCMMTTSGFEAMRRGHGQVTRDALVSRWSTMDSADERWLVTFFALSLHQTILINTLIDGSWHRVSAFVELIIPFGNDRWMLMVAVPEKQYMRLSTSGPAMLILDFLSDLKDSLITLNGSKTT